MYLSIDLSFEERKSIIEKIYKQQSCNNNNLYKIKYGRNKIN